MLHCTEFQLGTNVMEQRFTPSSAHLYYFCTVQTRKEGDIVYTLRSGTVKLTSGQQHSGTQSLSQTVQQLFPPSHLPCLNLEVPFLEK